MMDEPPKLHWLQRPETIRKLWIGSVAVLAVIALLDAVVHGHGIFGIDGTFGFYSWYGLLTCIAMVIFAKALGVFLKRGDNYYDRD
jgi:uncharacterized membrane protein